MTGLSATVTGRAQRLRSGLPPPAPHRPPIRLVRVLQLVLSLCLSLRFHVADCALFLCRPLTDERCDHCLSSSFTDFHRGSAAAIASLAVLFAVDAACQPWARGRGLPVDTQWATLAGDHSLGLSVDNLQYDAEEGKGSFLFDNAIDPVALNISPSA